MKNTFGNSISVTLFGESHGPKIGAVIDGIAPGIKINEENIEKKLLMRRPYGNISTGRVEADKFEIISGALDGYTTGAPICILIPNSDAHSSDYELFRSVPRPGHADLTAAYKYHGFQDYRGGGHFSGRITAALVAAGAILADALEARGIYIGTHLAYSSGIPDRCFEDELEDIKALNEKQFPVLEDASAEKMKKKIEEAAAKGDSVGGILESCVYGLPAGIGEPWFDTLEGVLSHALFSIPAVKGVEFGAGFGFSDMCGSEANDPFCFKDGKIITETNNNGGINGGISNGMPIIFRCAVKPTPTIFTPQRSVDISSMSEVELRCAGRHDPAIVHRARAVVDAVTAITIADMYALRYGTDALCQAK